MKVSGIGGGFTLQSTSLLPGRKQGIKYGNYRYVRKQTAYTIDLSFFVKIPMMSLTTEYATSREERYQRRSIADSDAKLSQASVNLPVRPSASLDRVSTGRA